MCEVTGQATGQEDVCCMIQKLNYWDIRHIAKFLKIGFWEVYKESNEPKMSNFQQN